MPKERKFCVIPEATVSAVLHSNHKLVPETPFTYTYYVENEPKVVRGVVLYSPRMPLGPMFEMELSDPQTDRRTEFKLHNVTYEANKHVYLRMLGIDQLITGVSMNAHRPSQSIDWSKYINVNNPTRLLALEYVLSDCCNTLPHAAKEIAREILEYCAKMQLLYALNIPEIRNGERYPFHKYEESLGNYRRLVDQATISPWECIKVDPRSEQLPNSVVLKVPPFNEVYGTATLDYYIKNVAPKRTAQWITPEWVNGMKDIKITAAEAETMTRDELMDLKGEALHRLSRECKNAETRHIRVAPFWAIDRYVDRVIDMTPQNWNMTECVAGRTSQFDRVREWVTCMEGRTSLRTKDLAKATIKAVHDDMPRMITFVERFEALAWFGDDSELLMGTQYVNNPSDDADEDFFHLVHDASVIMQNERFHPLVQQLDFGTAAQNKYLTTTGKQIPEALRNEARIEQSLKGDRNSWFDFVVTPRTPRRIHDPALGSFTSRLRRYTVSLGYMCNALRSGDHNISMGIGNQLSTSYNFSPAVVYTIPPFVHKRTTDGKTDNLFVGETASKRGRQDDENDDERPQTVDPLFTVKRVEESLALPIGYNDGSIFVPWSCGSSKTKFDPITLANMQCRTATINAIRLAFPDHVSNRRILPVRIRLLRTILLGMCMSPQFQPVWKEALEQRGEIQFSQKVPMLGGEFGFISVGVTGDMREEHDKTLTFNPRIVTPWC